VGYINYNDPVKNLPDAFSKGKDGNNYKIFQINKGSSSDLSDGYNQMLNMLDIDNAYGTTLDLWYGEKLQCKRGDSDDIQYLIRLKAKIMQNLADGSFSKLMEALAYILQCDPSEIHIVESENENALTIKSIPLEVIGRANLKTTQILKIISKLLPANVKIEGYNFTGTFEYSDRDNEYSEESGYGDSSGITGGYYGMTE
jgi:hypothetical protein